MIAWLIISNIVLTIVIGLGIMELIRRLHCEVRDNAIKDDTRHKYNREIVASLVEGKKEDLNKKYHEGYEDGFKAACDADNAG